MSTDLSQIERSESELESERSTLAVSTEEDAVKVDQLVSTLTQSQHSLEQQLLSDDVNNMATRLASISRTLEK